MNEKYKGATVNERLYLSGTLDKFDHAVEKKDIHEIIRILRSVNVDEMSIEAILKQIQLDKQN